MNDEEDRPATKRAYEDCASRDFGREAGSRRRRSCGVGHCWWWHRLRRCASAGCLRVGHTLGNTAQEVAAVRTTIQRGL